MFTQTPDTSWYMIMAYLLFIGLPVLYIASLWWRQRTAQRDEEMLKNLLDDSKKN